MTLVGKPAPELSLEGYSGGELVTVSLSALRGSWVLLLFYPLDFTPLCTTEVLAFAADAAAFLKRGCRILGISVDSTYTHKAWVESERAVGGLGGSPGFPLLSDLTRHTCRDFGVLLEETGFALRGLFLVDPEGVVVHETTNDLPVGRSPREALRVLEAFQRVAAHGGEVCPGDRDEGQDAVQATPEGVARQPRDR